MVSVLLSALVEKFSVSHLRDFLFVHWKCFAIKKTLKKNSFNCARKSTYRISFWNGLEWAGIDWNRLEYDWLDWNMLEYTAIGWNRLEYARLGWTWHFFLFFQFLPISSPLSWLLSDILCSNLFLLNLL